MIREDIKKAAVNEVLPCLIDYELRTCLDDVKRKSFIHGANWRIDSVWHDSSEEPNKCDDILLLFHDNSSIVLLARIYRPKWEDYIKGVRLVKWAYIKDLIPEE